MDPVAFLHKRAPFAQVGVERCFETEAALQDFYTMIVALMATALHSRSVVTVRRLARNFFVFQLSST